MVCYQRQARCSCALSGPLGSQRIRIGVPTDDLFPELPARLETLAGSPLPGTLSLRIFEDALMDRFKVAPLFNHINALDRPSILTLYGRYRALPNTINEDELAFIYAVLCIIRYSEIRLNENQPDLRHDVTYYRQALLSLRGWHRASIWSMSERQTMIRLIHLKVLCFASFPTPSPWGVQVRLATYLTKWHGTAASLACISRALQTCIRHRR